MKHTSTVLEPSIPFHTLVKLVDAEDIANDKTRNHGLTLEVYSISNQLQSQNLATQQSQHLVFTQPRDPNNKHKPAYKKYCSYCHRTNHSISACFKKQRDDKVKRDAYAGSKSPQSKYQSKTSIQISTEYHEIYFSTFKRLSKFLVQIQNHF